MVLICNSKRKDVLSSTSLMLIVFICIITISSCRNKKQETTKEIYDLENHEFKLPKYNFSGSKDELNLFLTKKYKIVVCVDSIGCFSCHLQLAKWKSYIKEMQNKKINFAVLFYINLKNKSIIDIEFINNGFAYPYFLDSQDSVNILNKIPGNEDMQTFLLNESNKIIGVGNPVINPYIKDFYYKLIFKHNMDSKIKNGKHSLSLSPKIRNSDINDKNRYTKAEISPFDYIVKGESYSNKGVMGFLSLSITPKYVYALYSGKKKKDNLIKATGKTIYIFDHKGNLKRIFNLDAPSIAIAVDSNDGKLYSLVQNGKTSIYVYNNQFI